MDRYLVPLAPTEKRKPITRPRWKRSLIELNGKFEPKYRHDFSDLLMRSYYEVGLFAHCYHVEGLQCPTHMSWFANVAHTNSSVPFRKSVPSFIVLCIFITLLVQLVVLCLVLVKKGEK